jgi:hypothetical protein
VAASVSSEPLIAEGWPSLVDGSCLENSQGASPRGFESLSLRQQLSSKPRSRKAAPNPDPNRLTPFLTPTGTDLCWTHRVDGYGKACLPSEPRMLEGDRDTRALVARMEKPDRLRALSPRVLEKASATIQAEQADVRRRLWAG